MGTKPKLSKTLRVRDRSFLSWAKEQGGLCCVCNHLHGINTPAAELHHWGDKGMGQKCDDHQVCRLCVTCHRDHQGKKGMAFHRAGEYELWCAMARDAVALLSAYLEASK